MHKCSRNLRLDSLPEHFLTCSAMALRLIIEDEAGATTIVPLGKDAVTIGRLAGNTIQLTEQNVSRHHARLSLESGSWMINDLGSYNGIKINNQVIQGRMRLSPGDLVQIGDYHLTLFDDVERKTLNIERPSRAANDEEPVYASSSSQLPKLVLADVVPQPPKLSEPSPSPRAPGSSPSPAISPIAAPMTPMVSGEPHASHRKPRVATFMVVIGVLAVAVAGGAVWLGQTSSGQHEAAAMTQRTQVGAFADANNDDQAATPTVVIAPEPVEEQPEAPMPAEQTPGDVARRLPRPRELPKRDKPRETKEVKKEDPRAPAVSPAATEPAPNVDPAALLSQARQAVLGGNASKAYQLAKQSFDIDKNPQALQVMGVAACKMGDVGKAKAAYKRMSADKQKPLASMCAAERVKLD